MCKNFVYVQFLGGGEQRISLVLKMEWNLKIIIDCSPFLFMATYVAFNL